MTKTEAKILDYVQHCNDLGAVAGVADKDQRFAKRLADANKIVYITSKTTGGKGWSIVGHAITEAK